MDIRGQTVFDQAGQHRPADSGEEEDKSDTDQHIHRFLPGIVVQPFAEVKQPPGAQEQHYGDTDGENARCLQRGGDPAVQPLLQLRIVALGGRGESDGFGYPARQDAGHQRRAADNRQAAQGGAHHKFQAVAWVEQGKEEEHHKVGAGQPVPNQGEGADKQAKKGERAVSQMDQPLRNHRFVMKNQIQRPQRNAQHDDDVSQRADLNIHLVRDNRHRDDQAVADQAAEGAQAQTPVGGGLVAEVKGPERWNARAENEPQDGFKELDQREGVEEKALLKGDSGVVAIQTIAQQLTDKQGQRQQQQIDNKRPGDGQRQLEPVSAIAVFMPSPFAHFTIQRQRREAYQPPEGKHQPGQQ